ncbi:histidine phosphatase family protein [uncultured Marivita sp.]|uniref:histidine phosphatase family protein n=1 Tax=uncultured Marivita sp. TaxID=888080 RepID=UPI00343AC9ED
MRHGQTSWNEAGLVMGQTDLPMSESGIQQAKAMITELDSLEVRTLFSSALFRCQQTAEFVSRALDLPITFVPGLEERCWGIYEGRHHTERDTTVDPPEGETLSQFQDRIAVALDLISASDRPLVVTHSGVIRYALEKAESDKSRRRIPHAKPILVPWGLRTVTAS